MLDFERVSRHPAQVQPSPYRADHTRVKQLETDNPFVTLVSRRG